MLRKFKLLFIFWTMPIFLDSHNFLTMKALLTNGEQRLCDIAKVRVQHVKKRKESAILQQPLKHYNCDWET